MSVSRFYARSAVTILAVAVLSMLPARSVSASMLQIIPSGPTTLMPGQSETISVLFTSTQNFTLYAAQIYIAYDDTRFSVSNLALGNLDTGNGFNLAPPTYTNPLAGVISTNSAGVAITTGQSGTLETFTLTALANAPAGGTLGNINLLATAGRNTGGVQDSNFNFIVLTPPPTNGYDPLVDATVLVGGAAVPEPSSLVLMGLGGGLIVVTRRIRAKARRRLAS